MRQLVLVGMVLMGASVLTSCSSIARSQADNTPVDALPLANVAMEGTVSDVATSPDDVTADPLSLASMSSQAIGWALVNATVSFGDLNPNEIPSIVGTPSGLDVPINFKKAIFKCQVTAPTLTGTLDWVKLIVSDSKTPQGISQEARPNTNMVFTRQTDGTYTVATDPAMLKLDWTKFSPVTVLDGTETKNKAKLVVNIKLNDVVKGCGTVLELSSTLKQYVRF